MKVYRPNTVTLIADASFCPDHCIGAWAIFYTFRAPSGKQYRFYRSGLVPECQSSHQAEVYAIHKGLTQLKQRAALFNRKLVVWNDNLNALATVDRKDLKANGATNVQLRHLYGHPEQRTNDCMRIHGWCDKMAKKRVREARAQVR